MKQDHQLYSVKQVAQLTGKSYRTIHNWIKAGKIEAMKVDSYYIVHEDQIDKINNDEVVQEPKFKLIGHKTIRQVAKILDIPHQNLKKYLQSDRVPHKIEGGVYFIPEETIALWKKVDNPNPNTVEAYEMGCVLIRDAALQLGVSDSKIRVMLAEGQLDAEEGYYRKYVTKASIAKHIGADNFELNL